MDDKARAFESSDQRAGDSSEMAWHTSRMNAEAAASFLCKVGMLGAHMDPTAMHNPYANPYAAAASADRGTIKCAHH